MAKYEDIQFFLPRAHTIDRSELEAFIDAHKVPVTITEDHTYDLMQTCDCVPCRIRNGYIRNGDDGIANGVIVSCISNYVWYW